MIATADFKPAPGQMRAHLNQNPGVGLPPTLFHDIRIPLEPFDSGLEWDEQPAHAEFNLEFVKLPVKDWRCLAGAGEQMRLPGSCSCGYKSRCQV